MRISLFFGISCAAAFHVVFFIFGGFLFDSHDMNYGTLSQVDLYSEIDGEKEKLREESKEVEEKEIEHLKSDEEKPPDASEVLKSTEFSSVSDAPELEAASLSSIEAALSGQEGGGGEFSESVSFASGGRIGGTGKGGVLGENFEDAFSLAEIDQKPRALFQAMPAYPQGMKSIEALVTILFIVDTKGKVINPRIEKSTHREFEKPALDAVKQWKFEPAIKGGERVPCKMRVPIRFKPKS